MVHGFGLAELQADTPTGSSGSSGSPASRTISGAGDGSSIRAGAGIGDRQVRDGRTGAGIGTGASTLGRSDALSAKVALGVGGTDAAGGTWDTSRGGSGALGLLIPPAIRPSTKMYSDWSDYELLARARS